MEHSIVTLCFLVLFSIVIQIGDCSRYSNFDNKRYVRIRRSKYYGPPQRFYRRPPMVYPIKGPFSYTPPPFINDDKDSYPPSRPMVSRRPSDGPGRPYEGLGRPSEGLGRPYDGLGRPSEGLGDEDINNLVKYLSKKDLDKIIEFAGGNDKKQYPTKGASDYNRNRGPGNREVNTNLKELERDAKYKLEYDGFKDSQTRILSNPPDLPPKVVYQNPVFNQNNIPYSNANSVFEPPKERDHNHIDNEEFSQFVNYVDNFPPNAEVQNIFTDDFSNTDSQRPSLREDHEASNTNNVPTVVNSNSYKLENFGQLPLMNYHNSKLHSVSSYHVPHYTITTTGKKSPPQQPSSSSSSSSSSPAPRVPVERAPPASAAQQQSDAHLKATKIWTHRSRGAAFYLHDDGTLTPER